MREHQREHQYVTTGECGGEKAPGRAGVQGTEGVQIKCRTYGAVTIPAETEVGTVIPLVNLNVDVQGYKKSCIKVEFLSNILTDTATATLAFQLLRQCNGQMSPIPAGPIWTFSRAVATADEANFFGFTTCDCDDCHCGCCNYSVVATVVGAPTTGTITINNATLIATMVEEGDC